MKNVQGGWGWYNLYQRCSQDSDCPFVCTGIETGAAFYCNGDFANNGYCVYAVCTI